MAAKPEDMLEYCERCGAPLELGQIGACDSCQDDCPQCEDCNSASEPSIQGVDMQRNVLVVVPSDQNDDCSLLFVAPAGMKADQANDHASAAINNATDDEGNRSGEVIAFLEPLGFECLGNPSIATVPAGIMFVTVAAPMYPAAINVKRRLPGIR